MTRSEGRRGSTCAAGRVLAAGLLLALSVPGAAGGWTIGGRFGLEVDGIGEEFASSALFDDRIDLDDTGLGDLEEDLVVSREAVLMGLLDLRMEHGSTRDRWLRIGNTTRIGASRHRNSFSAEGGLTRGSDRFGLDGRWDFLGGSDEPAAGSTATLLGSWDRRDLPLRFRSRIQLAADWSETEEGDLAAVFNYRTLRSQLELRRDLGSSLQIRGAGGWRDKTAMRSSVSSYSAGWGEVELSGSTLLGTRGDLSLRIEDRSYSAAGDSAGVPSSLEYSGDGSLERRLNRWLRPYARQRVEIEDYEETRGIFQDHRSWEAEVGTDLYPWERASSDTAAFSLYSSSWRIRLGGVYEIFRVDEDEDLLSFDATFDRFGGVVGLAREGAGSIWFDWSVESGRREYRNSSEGETLVFEGLNLSLASSDFTYLRTTLIAQWAPAVPLRTEVFLQWDAEYHDRSADDFHLWIVNVAVTRPF